MPDVLAVVKRSVFDWHDRHEGPLQPGDGPFPWDDYTSRHSLLDRYLRRGDRLFLATARPGGKLWLVAVYENLVRRREGWFGSQENRVRIIDITELRPRLKFHTGNGLSSDPDKLGNSLQTPRQLTDADIQLLENAVAAAGIKNFRRQPSREVTAKPMSADEGRRMRYEINRYFRDPKLAEACLRRDAYRCCHCGFSLTSLKRASASLGRVLHVHHIEPLKDRIKAKTTLKDLVTLCPTCHSVVHALAVALEKPRADLPLLRRHFAVPRPSIPTN